MQQHGQAAALTGAGSEGSASNETHPAVATCNPRRTNLRCNVCKPVAPFPPLCSVLQVCELCYSKATSNPACWVLAVPEASPVQRPEDLAGTIVASELVNTTRKCAVVGRSSARPRGVGVAACRGRTEHGGTASSVSPPCPRQAPPRH